ncbi:Protein EXORDIUM like [Actinidia chinensis var. chinensis]|uniref:Protein EXORDIUM like n=1 Tax=Actinidia chinensis var. chinensis TaxID=1590841 RepID=A0A2R6Q9J8_ACTCC|nr:Protein EXORDIUM like [Actinidia chinensis var. chinensis]
MESSLRKIRVAVSLTALFFLVHFLPFGSASKSSPILTYQNGPLLTGNVSLAVLWYGRFQPKEKVVVKTFIESLSVDRSVSFQPDVHSWWQKVESIVESANKDSGEVIVRIAREVDDEDASVGKVLSNETLPGLLQKATAGLANAVAVVFAARDVVVPGMCEGVCYLHGADGKQIYIVVGNPEDNCPGKCAIPFHNADTKPAAMTLQPPSGNVGADAVLIRFASALAETITNPFNTGFVGGKSREFQVARVCPGLYASGAVLGYPGNVRVDPSTGGAFNAHGVNNTKFLLPALMEVGATSCWTTL